MIYTTKGADEMGIASLFKRWNDNADKLEQELAQAYDRITELEAQSVHLAAENEDLRCEMEAMNSALNQPSYD
jgi:regulator of replication initiation timing